MGLNWLAALVPLAVLIGTVWMTGRVLGWLQRRAILDHPVDRSAHRVPVPRGGGLAVMPLILAAWLALALLGSAPAGTMAAVAVAAALMLLSWFDDLRGLPIGLRLLGHLAAALLGLMILPGAGQVFQGYLPPLLDRAATALLWVWFINLFNFMDGIDGITGTQTACLGLGIALVTSVAGWAGDGRATLALAVAAGGLGFLKWNWHPAKLFLGDSGSVPLGFLLGWLLLGLAGTGLWAPALILPLYYLADATLTLLRRALRGERVWRAHRQHFYQRALGPAGNHAAIVRLILAADLLLIGLAVAALARPFWASAFAILVTAGLLALLERRARHLA